MVSTNLVVGLVFAAMSGMFLSIQAGCNSTLGKHGGRSFASVVTFSTGLVCMLVYLLIDLQLLHNKGPMQGNIKAAPWWSWTGGCLGAFYIVTTITFSELIGASTLIGSVVSAQLLCALVLDSCGWAGFPKRSLHWAKVAGVVLMLTGVAMVAVFRGEVVDVQQQGSQVPAPQPSSLDDGVELNVQSSKA